MAGKQEAFVRRLMIGAESSGQGKTMITCGLIRLLMEQGMQVDAYKCGPDYIDPMFHKYVSGHPSYNLDSFFQTKDQMKLLLGRCEGRGGLLEGKRRICVIEGVMGYYDGLGGVSDRASSYEVSKITETPTVLIVDGRGRSFSALAAAKGYMDFRPDSRIKGILFNRTSPMAYRLLKQEAEKELGIRAVGFIPPLEEFFLKSRHLGLVRPEEIPEFEKQTKLLAEKIRPGIDVEALISLAEEAPPLSWEVSALPEIKKEDGTGPVIAVARDEAFCFYYQDNLEVLEEMNARLVFFSPMRDERVPQEADGLYLGGGYPELYGKSLSENTSMRADIKEWLERGMPCIAECGGYLYLKEWIRDSEGIVRPMCGLLPGGSTDAGRLKRFGYGTMEAKKDGVLGPEGTVFPAHEFHHWDGEENGDGFVFKKPVGTRNWDCGYITDSMYAGFPHLYFRANVPGRFLTQAAKWKKTEKKD